MQVIYRITGLDGDATEESIESIVDDEELLSQKLSQVLEDKIKTREGNQLCGIEVLLNTVGFLFFKVSTNSLYTKIISYR